MLPLACAIVVLLLAGVLAWALMIRMPGRSHGGPLPPLTSEEEEIAVRLRAHVERLAGEIGERNLVRRPQQLEQAAAYVEAELAAMGYAVQREAFAVGEQRACNLVAERPGNDPQAGIVIVGAHYDTVAHSPGANDNASAVASLLELARAFRRHQPRRSLRLVFFTNEEQPWFRTPWMGSMVHGRGCATRGEDVRAMLCLECMGCYSDEPRSQRYPLVLAPFYPSRGDFISFVGNLRSRQLVRRVITAFREQAAFPSEGLATTELVWDICRSDHYPFWRQGYAALMVTDTANFRYAAYHQPTDLPEGLDYERCARVVAGLAEVVRGLI